MYKIIKFNVLLALVLFSGLILSSCNALPVIIGSISATQSNNDAEINLPPVYGAEAARNTALAYIKDNYGIDGFSPELIWVGGEMQSNGMVGSSTFQYVADGWTARIVFPVVAPDATIYSIKVSNEGQGFSWEGLVDAFGQTVTTVVSMEKPTPPPVDVQPDPTEVPAPIWVKYTDDIYKIALEYPADWNLTEIPSSGSTSSKALKLTKGDWNLIIQYKFRWDAATLGGGLPAGEVVDRGNANLMGKAIPKHVLVYQDKDKVVYYGDRFEYLDFFIRLEEDLKGFKDYGVVDLPENIIAEMDKITATIIRTGEPVIPPTPTPNPTPTPQPKPCNAARFVSDVKIPDGTIFAQNTPFTKIWRLENVGTCTWTTDYDLIFVDGHRMEGSKASALDEKVKPGEWIDLSLEMTAPNESGDYKGFWMLRSSDGVIFGLGDAANKPFWISISVTAPRGNYAYDFGLNFCSATWRSENGRISCTEKGSSEDGFVILLEKPKLENRPENEIALWVHPNDERYGWIEGSYPYFKVKDGDHFNAWVGCLEGYNKCSLKFYLDYEDDDGRVRRLGEWLEIYDGQVTKIDIDLSDLAGQSVQFILGTEGLTKNFDAMQGFWFVPRIVRTD